MRLGIRDERVLAAFVDRRPAEGDKLRTDGQRLDGLWLGGARIADWDRDQIHFHDKGSRAAESVQRAVRRHAAPVQLAEYRGLSKTRGRRDTGRAAAIRQMKATNRVMKGKHGTGREWFKGVGTDVKRSPSRSSPQLARALRAVEEAWAAQYANTSQNARVYIRNSDRIHAAMTRAFAEGATQADIDRAMDRALARRREPRRGQFKRGARRFSSRLRRTS